MKKVLFVHHDSIQSGSGRCLYEFLDQLKPEDGITPIVLLHNKNTLYKVLKEKNIESYYCRFGYTCFRGKSKSKWKYLFWKYIYRNLANLWTYFFLRTKIDLKEIDVIHANSSIIDFGAFLHRKIRKPLVWHLREFGEKDFGFKPFYPSLPQYMCKNAAKIIAVSKVLVSEFVEKGGNLEKIECIYDGVLGNAFQKQCAAKLTDNEKKLKIVMTGRLSSEKGQIYAINAIHNLQQEYLKYIQLDFYGSGKDELILKQKVKEYGLEKNIHFLGFSDKLGDLLKNYDVGLVMSKSEAFGRITVEYMLSGVYVIGSNTGATPELLYNGKYGTLVEYGDSITIANEIEKILQNRDFYSKRIAACTEYARANYCIENNYKQIVNVLKSVNL